MGGHVGFGHFGVSIVNACVGGIGKDGARLRTSTVELATAILGVITSNVKIPRHTLTESS